MNLDIIKPKYYVAIKGAMGDIKFNDELKYVSDDTYYKMAIDQLHVQLAEADSTGHSWSVIVDSYVDHLVSAILNECEPKSWNYHVSEQPYPTKDDGDHVALVVAIMVEV